MQHINNNIRAKFKQIMINQSLEIWLQPLLLLWVSLITGDYHFVDEVWNLTLMYICIVYFTKIYEL